MIGGYHQTVKATILVVLLAAALFSFAQLAANLRSEQQRGIDLLPYWFYGHYLTAGGNPYAAFHSRAVPVLPDSYFPGSLPEFINTLPEKRPPAPANLPPMFLLLHFFAHLPWLTAFFTWAVLLVLMLLSLPRLIVKTFGLRFSVFTLAAFSLFVLSWPASRWAVINGQTTIFVVVLMLLSLLAVYSNRRIPAGLTLGLALSKYSIAIPIFFVYLLRRQWRILAVGIAVQAAAVLLMSLILRISPLQVVEYYTGMFLWITTSGERSGGGYVEVKSFLPNNLPITLVVQGALSAIVFGGVAALTLIDRAGRLISREGDLWLMSVFSVWALLVEYHRIYDLVLLVFPVAYLWAFAANGYASESMNGQGAARRTIAGGLILVAAILFVPGEDPRIEAILPAWSTITRVITTTGLGFLLAMTFWVGYRQVTAATPARGSAPVAGTARFEAATPTLARED